MVLVRATLFVGSLLAATLAAAAASVSTDVYPAESATARLDRGTIAVGETATLLVEVRGEGAVDPELLDLPRVAGLDLGAANGPTLRRDDATGEFVACFEIAVHPLVAGDYTIPPLRVVVRSDDELLTAAVAIRVEAPAETGIAFRLRAARDRVFVNEPFEIGLRIERPSDAPPELAREIRLPWFSRAVDLELATPVEFDREVFELEGRGRRVMFATSPGPPGRNVLEATMRVLVPEAGEVDFAGSMLRLDTRTTAEYGERPGDGPRLDVPSPASAIRVDPFPPGAPAEFVDAVGDFELTVESDRLRVGVGETLRAAIRIRARDSARTNLSRALFARDFTIPGFRVFGRNDERAEHPASEQLVIRLDVAVQDARVTTFPALRFAWFDPQRASYVSGTTQPTAIEVVPVDPSVERTVGEAEGVSRETWEARRALAFALVGGLLVVWLWRVRRRLAVAPSLPVAERRTPVGLDEWREAKQSPLPYSLKTARVVAAHIAGLTNRSPAACFGRNVASALRDRGASAGSIATVVRYFDTVESVAFGGAVAPPDRELFDSAIGAIEALPDRA